MKGDVLAQYNVFTLTKDTSLQQWLTFVLLANIGTAPVPFHSPGMTERCG